jgi:hypothetical protein
MYAPPAGSMVVPPPLGPRAGKDRALWLRDTPSNQNRIALSQRLAAPAAVEMGPRFEAPRCGEKPQESCSECVGFSWAGKHILWCSKPHGSRTAASPDGGTYQRAWGRVADRFRVCYKEFMGHNLPPTPAFRDAVATDPIQEIALRVIAELPGWELHVLGTATLIGSNLAISAKHVLEAANRVFGAKRVAKGVEIDAYSLRLCQVLPGPIYRIWNVFRAWICPSDIAILHLGLDRSSHPEGAVQWRVPILRVMPPPSGQKVLAFGYRESKIEVSEGADGTHHIVLNDVGTTSVGEVGQIFPERRDSAMLTFPCFEILARFPPGMSGGLVIDEGGALSGLVCTGFDLADQEAPLSYAATLWPMLTTIISADRGEAYPRGVEYPVIDLVLDGLINVVGLEELDPRLFPGRALRRTGS